MILLFLTIKTNMNFLSRLCVVLGILFLFMFSINRSSIASSENSNKKTISIGIYAPFTNNSAYIGRNILGAVELARDQLKNSEINYEFHTLDTELGNKERILQKFIETCHINVLLTEDAGLSAFIAPLAKKNNLIHFCLGCSKDITDGKNNFHTLSPNYRQGAILTTTMTPGFIAQFKQEYFSHPITQAGYAYDVFHVLNKSILISINSNSNCSSQTIASNLLALGSGKGIMGIFNLDKKGVSYKKEILMG
jgi:branched-chain amino acid transport system substrate-binding protein